MFDFLLVAEFWLGAFFGAATLVSATALVLLVAHLRDEWNSDHLSSPSLLRHGGEALPPLSRRQTHAARRRLNHGAPRK